MKRLIILLALLTPVLVFGQRVNYSDTIYMGSPDTVTYETGTLNDNIFGGFGSYQLNYRNIDDVDATLSLYWSHEHPDSATYILYHVDLNLDGTNDNPWTLSDTANGDFGITFDHFYGRYFIRIIDCNSVTDSTIVYEYLKQQ